MTSTANAAVNLATQAPNVQEEKHLLNFDGTNMIKEPVFCGEQPWDGYGIILAEGSQVMHQGAAEILVTHKTGSDKGKTIVMAMSGMELLMGNDFLKQLGSIRINY
ncbi:hypothetical protein OUZ56_012749 [Daphnia magna]|uniref:Uncharacterized protein n=1 Tax=Daphnia magna TaxID=35525 RepID=A0ABQ9Z3Y0_9CRUS|nr:hypothetical protein OUZ56_012749 [Daphnia magna]